MTEPVIHISFDLIGVAIILLMLLLIATGLVLLTSWHWKRRLARSSTVGQLEALLDRLPMGLLLTDQQGQVLWCNPEACQLLSLDRVSPQLERGLVSIMKRVAESRQSELHELQPAANVRLQLRAMPLDDPYHPEDTVICMVTDVSERRHQGEFYRSFVRCVP